MKAALPLPSRSSNLLPRRLLAALLLTLAALPATAQYSGGFGKNKVVYREFEWKIYHSPHFDVYYYTEEEPLLQKVVSFAESAYDRLSREFDHQIQEPTPLIFYATHSAFEQNNIILNFIPEGVGAFASAARNRMVLPVDLPDRELMGLILHELTHIFQYHVLFQGSYGRSVTAAPPQWFMEGMASYMAKDEQTHDRMVVRDAVVNDLIPAITQRGIGGYAAYRFGHATFDFIEERWGKEGFLDFIYEFRNTLGANVGRAVERTFKLEAEDFDVEFRRWLRKQYLPQLIETGEPSDFGRLFRTEAGTSSEETSPVASPSGELVASITTYRNQVDIALFDARKRRLVSNITSGFSDDYQYLTAQFLTTARQSGRDLAFSPDGNQVAAFAKREKGRALLLVDVLKGRLERVIEMDVEQQLAPTFSADGRKVAFSGNRGGQFDIFVLDLDTAEVVNLTADDIYDAAPVFSPDGSSLVYSAVLDEGANLFRLDLTTGERFRLTAGNHNDVDATFSSDGGRLYFTSDRNGADNIYSLDLASGRLLQWTNAVTGCFQPTVLRDKDSDRLVFTGYWRGNNSLYVNDLEAPVAEIQPAAAEEPSGPTDLDSLARFQPDIEVAIDEANREDYGRGRFFLEDAGGQVGVTDDQTFLANTYLSFSDYLGDRRIFASFSSVESFANFDIAYIDLRDRLQWSVRLFDDRTYYIGIDQSRGTLVRGRAAYKITGALGEISYPLSFYLRAEAGIGYLFRELAQQVPVPLEDGTTGLGIVELKDDFPFATAALVGDTTVFSSVGPVSGRRWRLRGSFAPDLDGSGTLDSRIELDLRQYAPITRRSGFAFRLFGGAAYGNSPAPFYFGGLDTLRGFDFRELVGDRVFFANAELRFPLVDVLATPVLAFRGIRGRVFLDVGGAYFKDFQSFHFWDGDENRLDDGVSSYGWGITVDFGGLDLNWDFAQQWDLRDPVGDDGFRTSFWIGGRF